MPIAPREEPSAALALLGVHAGPRTGEEIPVRTPVITIGNGAQSGIVLGDDSVSSAHARLEYDAGGWFLTDLGSTNGTYVEGVRLAPQIPTQLAYGSIVRFGGMALEFRQVEAADPEAARASFAPQSTPTPLAERRRGFRLPVWLFLLILILLGMVLFFVLESPTASPVGMLGAGSFALSSIPPGAP